MAGLTLAGCGSQNSATQKPPAGSPAVAVNEPSGGSPSTEGGQGQGPGAKTRINNPGASNQSSTSESKETVKNRSILEKALGSKLPIPPTVGPDRIPAPAGTEGWTASKVTPMDLAKKVDATIRTLSGVSGDVRVFLDYPDGGKGQSEAKLFVKNPRTFRIESMGLGLGGHGREVVQIEQIGDGSDTAELGVHGWTRPKPVGARQPESSLLAAWPKQFPRLMFSGLQTGHATWTELVAQASKPNSGVVIRSEEKKAVVNGHPTVTRRILMTRTPAQAKKLGPMTVEMVVGSSTGLPLTIKSTLKQPHQKGPLNILWTTYWRKGLQNLPPNAFVIPVKHAKA